MSKMSKIMGLMMNKYVRVLVSFVLMIVCASVFYMAVATSVETLNVTKAERIDTKYLIFTEQGVYGNSDSFLHLKFDSSDVYNKLSSGGEFDCKTYGFRVPLFSMYKNIVSCEKTGE